MTYIPARPTTYRGTLMRSRLEARFAAYLDSIGKTWEYEPMAFADQYGQYLPDFAIKVRGDDGDVRRGYVEVRPTLEGARAAFDQMVIIWSSEPDAVLVVAVADSPWFVLEPGGDEWLMHSMDGWTP